MPGEGGEGEGAFAHVDEALGNAHHEEGVCVAVVVGSELAEELGETGVVGAGAEHAHGEDGVEGNLEVVVVAVFGERIEVSCCGVGCSRHAGLGAGEDPTAFFGKRL